MTDYAVAPDVGWVASVGGARVALALLPDGAPAALHGTSALIWLAAVDGGDLPTVVRRVAERAGEDEATVHDDVVAFLEQLVERRFLLRT